MALKLGQTVETSTQQQGLIRYIGPIHVAEGVWLGIELPSPEGKNDGSVRGERYFTCPPGHGLFIRELNVSRVVAQPAPKTPAAAAATPAAKPKTTAPAAKPRPSSVVAAKPAPRPSSIINKRQSLAPALSKPASVRTPARKPSIASSSITSASETTTRSAPRSTIAPSTASSSTLRSSRDSNVDALQTKNRHLEKQLAEEQERVKELSQAKEERDRFHAIIQKLQTKYQTLHSEHVEVKAQAQALSAEVDSLTKAQMEHEQNLEIATIDKEIAEEKIETTEHELDDVRAKLEERDMEVEILQEQVNLFTADMTTEDREKAGWYQLEHENGRLREALITLKDITSATEHDLKSRILEAEEDASRLETVEAENDALKQELATTTGVVEHLRGQLDANVELEEMNEELVSKVQLLEDSNAEKDAAIRDLVAIKNLSDELEVQQQEQEEELRTELDARDVEITQQAALIADQNATITDQDDLITKMRELVFELQGKITDAESSRTMTEAQAKDTTSRFNEVMDLNRRLRASNVQATNKEITSELRKLRAEEADEKLAIYKQTESADFGNSESVRAYFTAKSIASKATLVSTLLSTTDRQLSYNGGLEEAFSRVHCNQAVYHLELIRIGSERLWFAMSVSTLDEFGTYGPMYQELLTIEKALDQGLDALKVDEVRFDELAGTFGRSVKIQDELITKQTDALLCSKENETLARVQNFYASLRCLDTNYAIVITMLRFLIVNSESLSDEAEQALERVEESAAPCNKAMHQCQKLVKALENLKADSLRPVFGEDERAIFIDFRKRFAEAAMEAPGWSQKALQAVKAIFEPTEQSEAMAKLDVNAIAGFTELHYLKSMDQASEQLELWYEFCSVLMNNVEFEHGPSPWAQKAKEAEEARKKHEEVLSQLEQLKAEQKATRTSLIESARVVETKNVAIEHLEAKYRDATKKVVEHKQLNDKLVKAEQDVKEMAEHLEKQRKEIVRLQERAAQVDRSDVVSPVAETSNATARLAADEMPSTQRGASAGAILFLEALQNENHWLRKRENSDAFGRSMRHLATQLKDEHRSEQCIRGEISEESYLNLDREDENAFYQPRRKMLNLREENARMKAEEAKSSPLALSAIRFESYPARESPWEEMHRMRKYLEIDMDDTTDVTELDLYAEGEWDEMGDPDGVSGLDETDALPGFTQSGGTHSLETFSSIQVSFRGLARDVGAV